MGFLGSYLLLSFFVTISHQVLRYRLPTDSRPDSYEIKLIPHLIPDNFTFDGEMEISLSVFNETNTLTLNSHNLVFSKENTFLRRPNGKIHKPSEHIIKTEEQYLILVFPLNLEPGTYQLYLKYTGLLNDYPKGFFRDFYYGVDSKPRFLAATQFEPTHARQAFPCWDEPVFKAIFQISIKHLKDYKAVSNMPLRKQQSSEKFDGKVWSIFEKSPRMSTYNVAFAVSDFKKINNPYGNFSIWCKQDNSTSMSYGFNIGLRAISLLERYTGIPYELSKMDIFCIPSLQYGVRESWGLIMAGESLLKGQTSSSVQNKLSTSTIMVYGIAHQLFGNVVTPAWWKDLWVTEGLATYFNYFLAAKVINFPRILESFIVVVTFNNFRIDASLQTLPVLRDVSSSKDADDLLNSTPLKAATVVQMINKLLSEEVFHTGIKILLQRFKYRTVTSDDFWKTMQETMDKYNRPHVQFDLKEVVEPYLSKKGYPVVNVDRDYENRMVKLIQKCVGCEENVEGSMESKWWIPINFATRSSPNFTSTSATHWMDPDKGELVIEGIDPKDWIVINIQSFGYYRVNYDEENWNQLAEYLNTDEFSNIHPINRAKLLDDALWAVHQKKGIDKNFLTKLVSYLYQELDYIPWHAGEEVINYIYEPDDSIETKSIALHLTKKLLTDSLEKRPEGDFFTIAKKELAQRIICKYANHYCKHDM